MEVQKKSYVQEFKNACIVLEPGELSVSEHISKRTLQDMDRAVANYKLEKVSDPIELF